jgi:hypothetical protein
VCGSAREREPGAGQEMAEGADVLREQAQRIVQSGALGRSRSYARLLEFLVECAASNRAPKEVEVAIEVFGRGPDFDPSQDSMVRVYAHNLRQKLEHYYATVGRGERDQLTLARGEYRVSLMPLATDNTVVVPPASAGALAAPVSDVPAPPPAAAARTARFEWRTALAAVLLLGIGVAAGVGLALDRTPPPAAEALARSPIWAGLLDDDLPILIVAGDYYIFGELDEHGNVARLVRDFDVGSRQALDQLMKKDPTLVSRYLNLDLNYLPSGAAFALLDVLRVLYTSEKTVRVVAMSEMSEADLKSSHVVYVGYISALDKLEDFVFASSSLAIGYTYDELQNVQTGELYSSEAGLPEMNRNYRDYGFISTFPGPGGNQIMVVSGTRDAGLMQAAHALSDPTFLPSLEQARPDAGGDSPPAFEALYEVTGYGRTNLDAMLVHTAALNYQQIWGGTLRHASN